MQDLQEWESLSLYISIDADNFVLALNEEDAPATISMTGPLLDMTILKNGTRHYHIREDTFVQ